MFATEAPRGERAQAEELVRGLADAWRFTCDEIQVAALSSYAASLLRWSARINLTAARTLDAVVAEHFVDAFALARRLDQPARVDRVGSRRASLDADHRGSVRGSRVID